MKTCTAFAETARAIAVHLGQEWALDEDWWANNAMVRFSGPDGACIHMRPTTYEYLPDEGTRLEIAGSYPRHPRAGSFVHGKDCPRITVSAAKAPDVIAKDILKRFWPRYIPLYREAIENKRRYEEKETVQKYATHQLAQIMGSKPGQNRVYLPAHCTGHGHIEVQHGGDRVNIKLSSIPLARAKRIAAILGEKSGCDPR